MTWSIANSITTIRLVTGPVALVLLVQGDPTSVLAALVLAMVAEASDLIDGYVARATGSESKLGKVLDPLADSLYRSCVFLGFLVNAWISPVMFAAFVGRDICVSHLRELAEQSGWTLGARSTGKWKALVQGGVQVLYLGAIVAFGAPLDSGFRLALDIMLWAAVGVTMVSLLDYAYAVFDASRRSDEHLL